MDIIKDWIATIVILAVIIVAMEALLPNNSIKKYAKFALNLLIIPVLLTPLLKIVDINTMENSIENYAKEIGLSSRTINISSFNEYENLTVKTTFENNLNEVLVENLQKKFEGYLFEVKTTTELNKENLTINQVKIYVREKDTIEKIEKVTIDEEKEKDKILNVNVAEIKKYIADDLGISRENVLILDGK